MTVHVGVKSDPIENRYSFDWLFGLMAEQHVGWLQLGSSFPFFHAEAEWFRDLSRRAERRGIRIESTYSSYREMTGFFAADPHLEAASRFAWERLIQVAVVGGRLFRGIELRLGAPRPPRREGARPRAVLPPPEGALAHREGRRPLGAVHRAHVVALRAAIDPRGDGPGDPGNGRVPRGRSPPARCPSSSAPTSPTASRTATGGWWSTTGACSRRASRTRASSTSRTPTTGSTGPSGSPRRSARRGIVDLERFRALIDANADRFPVQELVGYLELPGPKTGRDYTDNLLGSALGESLAALKAVFG